MMRLFILLLGFCSFVFAEQETVPNQVYNGNSQLNVKNLNKAVEIIRDPTAMSGNFRKALRNLPGSAPVQGKTDEEGYKSLNLPEIELVGKMFSENGPPSVVFKARGKYHHFEEGEQVSKVINNQVVTIKIEKITKQSVRVLVMPFNKTLIFN